MNVLVVFGTRPEIIKLAPVIRELKRKPRRFRVRLLATAQHRGMLDQMLDVFGLHPDLDLNLMRPGQSLDGLTARIALNVGRALRDERPDLVIVQGDTTTAMVSALTAFHQGIAVAHVEAGLRTGDLDDPFPEEMNRKVISALASWHFAPTRGAARNLKNEGVPSSRIAVTGNTVIDALAMMDKILVDRPLPLRLKPESRLVLVTAHRRESFGRPLDNICSGLIDIARTHPDVEIVYPVHPNPNVRAAVQARLSGRDRIHLIRPLDYFEFLSLLKKAYLVLTDSGGIQEEAPFYHKPVLVLRKRTERPEGLAAGVARLTGTNRASIVREATKILDDPRLHARMSRGRNPYGDGQAARRIAAFLEKRCASSLE